MMILFHNPISPFVRKVEIAARELGLWDQIEAVDGNYNDPNSELFKASPVGKIPALRANDGRSFTSSHTICRFLDSLSNERALFPGVEAAKFRVIENEALADALADAGVDRMRNSRIPDREPSAYEEEKQKGRMKRILDSIEANPAWLSDKFYLDDIAWISTLEYLDFRFSHEPWREGRSALTAWYNMHKDRPSVVATQIGD